MLSIKNNLMAENAARYLSKSYDVLAKSVERLSSGLRINSAKDDAAGLAVRELIRADVATLKQGSRNARDGISMLQTAEGALSAIDDILVRMKELAEQASTESYSADQVSLMNDEFGALSAEIDRIVNNTTFNGINLLNANGTTKNIHLGTTETIAITSKDLTTSGDLALGSRANWMGVGVSDTGSSKYIKGDDAKVMKFKFEVDINGDSDYADDNETLTISVTPAAAGWTLQQTVDAINSASRALMDGWNAASAVCDNVTGQYHLKVEAQGARGTGGSAGAVTFTGDAAVVWDSGTALSTVAVASGHFIKDTGTAGADLRTNATGALTAVQNAIKTKDEYRAKLGYLMNRLEAAGAVTDIQAENLLNAEARISDVDVASEMAAMTRTNVLAQAGISMLAQANNMPQMALQLLRG